MSDRHAFYLDFSYFPTSKVIDRLETGGAAVLAARAYKPLLGESHTFSMVQEV